MTENTVLTPTWTLALGPGPQADLLLPLLTSLASQAVTREGEPRTAGAAKSAGPARVEAWADLDELLGGLSARGRLVLDVDRLPREDLGLVRRFLERRSGWEILLLAEEFPVGFAARLLAHHRVHFAAWPLPVNALADLLATPSIEDAVAPRGEERHGEPSAGSEATPPSHLWDGPPSHSFEPEPEPGHSGPQDLPGSEPAAPRKAAGLRFAGSPESENRAPEQGDLHPRDLHPEGLQPSPQASRADSSGSSALPPLREQGDSVQDSVRNRGLEQGAAHPPQGSAPWSLAESRAQASPDWDEDGDLLPEASDDLGPLADLDEIEEILAGVQDGSGSLHPADLIQGLGSGLPQSGPGPQGNGTTSLLEEALSIGLSREELDAFQAPDFLEDEDTTPPSGQQAEPLAEAPVESAEESGGAQNTAELQSVSETAPPAAPPLAPPASPTPVDPAGLEDPPRWYRPQVADLADLAQRLQLDSLALREAGGAASGASDIWFALEQDIMRLGQFTRTLSFVAAPPPLGSQRLDLTTFTQETLAGLVNQAGESSLRVLFRGPHPLPVQGDKALLAAALDAMAQLAVHCIDHPAGQEQVSGPPAALRVRAESDEQGGAEVEFEFPVGPLGGLAPQADSSSPEQGSSRADLLRPYALRRIFPDFGANALAAAVGILTGQGGSLTARELPAGRLSLLVRMPLAQ